MKIILASSSPRRSELLKKLGISFEIYPPDIDESARDGENTSIYVHRLAVEKAMAVSSKEISSVVIAGDVAIEFEGKIIGKINDREEVIQTILSYQNKPQYLRGGFAVVKDGVVYESGVVTSTVEFKTLTRKEINDYLDNYNWQDKAGGYAIQEGAKPFVKYIEGSHSNVIGLPLVQVAACLLDFGVKINTTLDELMEADITYLK